MIRRIRSAGDRLWTSPGGTTAFSVLGRVIAFLAPVPFITANFPTDVVALWFVILTFQAFATSVIGVLPTILMHMVSYANAGSSKLGDHAVGTAVSGDGMPNEALLNRLARGLLTTFLICAAVWIVLAATIGTWVVWRPVQMSGVPVAGFVAWAIFVATSACRLLMQAYAAFLLGKGHVAKVRRLEAVSWTAGGLVSAASLAVYPNFIVAMALLQAPVVINLLLLRRMARAHGWRPSTPAEAGEIGLASQLLPRALRGGVGTFMSYLIIYGSGLMFAQIGDSEEVAAFAFALNIFGIIGQLALSPLLGALPSLSRLLTRGQLPEQNSLAQSAMFKGLVIYTLAVPAVPVGIALANLILPTPLIFVDLKLWGLMAGANFLFRYGALHLHYFTITNDIRWHIIDGVNAVLFLALLGLQGATSVYAFPACQAIAVILFYVPYARRLTLVHFGFGPERDIKYALGPFVCSAAVLAVLEFV